MHTRAASPAASRAPHLLLRIALELVEHLLRAEGNLRHVAAAMARQAHQQRKQPRVQVQLDAVLAAAARRDANAGR